MEMNRALFRMINRPLWRWIRFLRDVIIDAIACCFSIFLVLSVVEGRVPPGAISIWAILYLLGIAATHVFVLFSRGVYSLNPRYFALHDFTVFAFSATFPGTLLAYLQYRSDITGHDHAGITSLFLLYLCVSTALLAALRVAYGQMEKSASRDRTTVTKQTRTLIAGAGDAGELMLREIKLRQAGLVKVVGFVDDDPRKQSLRIHGIKVLGTLDNIPEIVERWRIDEILITIPVATGGLMRRLLGLCSKTTARVKTLPGLTNLVSDGDPLLPQLRDIQVEDLLRRKPVPVDPKAIAGYLREERIMITGGGGSIGSELARQICKIQPKAVILVGRGENSIYEIEQELLQTTSIIPETAIVDIRDREAVEAVFVSHKPTVVFHTAAHKHVPLMQKSVAEAIKNNVVGTRNVAELSAKYSVKRFIQISTDKAVNPTSVMGATKRVCELIVGALSQGSDTRFSIVRFGNVLGSRGSLIPLLNAQIKRGGPVTVTHQDMTRYFMTIPEAVQLVMQAGALGGNGETFILDMGDPVRIEDLAMDLIRLHGFLPGDDIAIRFTGVRPGEKLEEQLAYSNENLGSTEHPKIRMIAEPARTRHPTLFEDIERLEKACSDLDPATVLQMLMDVAHCRSLYPQLDPQQVFFR